MRVSNGTGYILALIVLAGFWACVAGLMPEDVALRVMLVVVVIQLAILSKAMSNLSKKGGK